MSETTPQKQAFPLGAKVRIADHTWLVEFAVKWRFYHKLQPEQLACAGREAIIVKVGFYYGGDAVYQLEGIPGTWPEACLGGHRQKPNHRGHEGHKER
jgi:hypothetical protein